MMGYLGVSMIHGSLTRTIGALMCVCGLCAHVSLHTQAGSGNLWVYISPEAGLLARRPTSLKDFHCVQPNPGVSVTCPATDSISLFDQTPSAVRPNSQLICPTDECTFFVCSVCVSSSSPSCMQLIQKRSSGVIKTRKSR